MGMGMEIINENQMKLGIEKDPICRKSRGQLDKTIMLISLKLNIFIMMRPFLLRICNLFVTVVLGLLTVKLMVIISVLG